MPERDIQRIEIGSEVYRVILNGQPCIVVVADVAEYEQALAAERDGGYGLPPGTQAIPLNEFKSTE